MDQLYGVRWSQNFGNDPLGKYKNADGEQNPRMEQWIETFRPLAWPSIRLVVNAIRTHPKPKDFDGWLPDLQIIATFIAGIERPQKKPMPNLAPFGAWIGRVCDARLIRIIADHGPFDQESLDRLATVNRVAKEKFMAMLTAGDLTQQGTTEEVEVINKYLTIQHQKLTIAKLTPEEEQEALIRWQRARGLLTTLQRK